MKTKNFSKKLTLNKNTIANLNSKEMRFVKGGGDTYENCFTNDYDYLCNSYMPCNDTQDISACPEWTVFCTPI